MVHIPQQDINIDHPDIYLLARSLIAAIGLKDIKPMKHSPSSEDTAVSATKSTHRTI